ncbi:rRNA maturation RNase YbeY [Segetibacter koreensis]|uniref:rRNA maturation RNase YbeY n=1 Tax=Segetibacter koreensis TaxID=398037 RepID=UPI00036D3689|nr:rRNA maturation RNase YbeY [Segetibacter koreensis]
MALIRFNYADVPPISLSRKKLIKDHIREIFLKEGKQLRSLSFIFCSDQYLIEINKTFLKHDFYTDIITFDLSEGEETVGEIYISVERVKENAVDHSSSFTDELLRVIFHGALHLCGYRDKKKSEITTMREKEDYYLQTFQKKTS